MIHESSYQSCAKGELSSLYVEFKTAFTEQYHWTELQPGSPDHGNLTTDKLAKLKQRWGSSLVSVAYGSMLTLGERIGEGSQAVIYEALLGNRPCGLIAKVFKEPLLVVQSQWPANIFELEGVCKYITRVFGGALLNDGRYAFLMLKFEGDLRKVINENIVRNNGGKPFNLDEALHYMLRIASGMKTLHSKNILHRDLKAANVLVWSHPDKHACAVDVRDKFYCAVSDFETSIGVLGTAFWRPPEMLQALQDGHLSEFEITTKVDVYGFAMTCYEILTGQVPYKDNFVTDYNLVINGQRPELPNVCAKLRGLLGRCWHQDPTKRPEFSEIVHLVGEIMTTELNIPKHKVEWIAKARPDYM